MSAALSSSGFDRVVVVTRKTELEELMGRYSTRGQTKFVLSRSSVKYEAVEQGQSQQDQALDQIMAAIPSAMKSIHIDRAMVPQFEFLNDVVIALGPDGLVSNTAKYLPSQPLIGVNVSPQIFDGVLLPWSPESVGKALNATLSGQARLQSVVLAEARMQDGRRLLAFNDLFVGAKSHVSARYSIEAGGVEEAQSSSGIIVSTGAGSTGWLRSVQTGARAIAMALGGTEPNALGGFDRGMEKLVFSVREPFPSRATGVSLVYGVVTREQPLVVASRMSQGGVIFSDGVEFDFLEFNSGSEVTISISDQRAHLVVA